MYGNDVWKLCMEICWGYVVRNCSVKILYGNHVWKSCMDILYGSHVWKSCMEIMHGNLLGQLCMEILHENCVWKFVWMLEAQAGDQSWRPKLERMI